MLHLLLAGTSALALLAGTAAANADIFGFMPETVQSFTVMTSGTYDIIAAGAQGGGLGADGGKGAVIGGDLASGGGRRLFRRRWWQ
jgi:hypothetical protein